MVGHSVAVSVQKRWVANITNAVAVGVFLPRVRHRTAIIREISHTIAVGIVRADIADAIVVALRYACWLTWKYWDTRLRMK